MGIYQQEWCGWHGRASPKPRLGAILRVADDLSRAPEPVSSHRITPDSAANKLVHNVRTETSRSPLAWRRFGWGPQGSERSVDDFVARQHQGSQRCNRSPQAPGN